jgi:hypothetical protein
VADVQPTAIKSRRVGVGPVADIRVSVPSDHMAEVALRRAFVATAAVWLAAIIVATAIAAEPRPTALAYVFSTTIYFIGSLICHQRPERSFHVWGAQFPICARCAGIYGGAVAGAVTGLVRGEATQRFRKSVRLKPDTTKTATLTLTRGVLIGALLPAALTLCYEWTTGLVPANSIRAASGVALGAAAAWVVVRPPAAHPS